MPTITEVDYSPALTKTERNMLAGIESNIAKAVWNVHQFPRVRWAAWQDENGRTIYALVNWHQHSEIIVYYNETEVRRLIEITADNEIAFGSRRQILPGFTERPE